MRKYLIDMYNFSEEEAVEIEKQYKLLCIAYRHYLSIDEFVKLMNKDKVFPSIILAGNYNEEGEFIHILEFPSGLSMFLKKGDNPPKGISLDHWSGMSKDI